MYLFQELRFALRRICKRPTVSAIVVLTLGLGLGANGIFFAVFYGSALRPLPFEEPERLVALRPVQPTLGETRVSVSTLDFHDWTQDSPLFDGAGAFVWKDFNLHTADEPDRLAGCAVTADLFPMLGVEPFLGRNFSAEEDRPGGPLVTLLGHEVWRERFAGDLAIVGKTVRLDDQVHEVVGVMPEGFEFSHFAKLWTPLQLDPATQSRDDRHLSVVARLARDTHLTEAKIAMTALGDRLAARYPENAGWTVDVNPLRDTWMPATSAGKLAMVAQLVLVAGVLLIVCANVTNVLLAQATARRREKALRAALGASRGALIRQTLVESMVLALGGGLLGGLLASQTDVAFASMISVPLPYWLDFGLEAHGLAYILGATLVAGVLIGLLPALRSSGHHLLGALRGGGGSADRRGGWLRRLLVVGEYAVALVILVSGLLMVKSFDNLRQMDRGFATQDILTLQLPLTTPAYDDEVTRATVLDEALRRLEGLAETAGVGATNALPVSLDIEFATTEVDAEGLSFVEGEAPRVLRQAVSPGYFEALSMPRLAGRTFTAEESSEGADAVLVNASLAELLWPGEDPLHRRIRPLEAEPGPWLEVVGVVGDIEPSEMLPGLGGGPRHRLYLPLAGTASPSAMDAPPRTPTLVLASRGSASQLVPSVRQELRAVDSAVPLFEVRTLEEHLDRFYFAQHLWSRTFSAMAFLALLIAAVGVYGVTSYSVSLRVREMGIRLALGASPWQLLTRVVRQGLVLAVVGVALGLAAAVPMARAMEMLLYDMPAIDPGVFTTVVGVLLGVGFLASFGPARRAASADPIVALRDE